MRALEATVARPLDDAEVAVREVLAGAGFGVLTEIDVAAIFRDKLGVERPALKILGACNPVLAQRALEYDPSTALVLPCNVVLEDVGGGHTRVAIVDPRELIGHAAEEGGPLHELAQDAAAALGTALDHLG